MVETSSSIFNESELDEIENFFNKTSSRQMMLTRELLAAKQSVNNPILKLPPSSNIMNGMICCKIDNISDIIQGIDWHKTSFSCKLSYQFNFSTKTKHYDNKPFIRNFRNVRSDGHFWLKVPLFLLPYSMEFEFVICLKNVIQKTMTAFISKEHRIEIPSILLENKVFNIGDKVEYEVENADYVRGGTITKFLENDMIEIRTDREDMASETDEDKLIVIKPKESVSKESIQRMFVEDLTHTAAAYNDLILRIGDNEEAFVLFGHLMIYVDAIYNDLWVDGKIDFEQIDFKFVPEITTVYIFEFLYSAKYYHRMNCMICNAEMVGDTQWPYNVNKNILNYRSGIDDVDAQEVWDYTGYGCDLCRMEVRYFQQMWHCQGDAIKHDFCMSCIHFMMQQYYEMQEFLMNLLNRVVNKDIIQEIVVFCVGKVNKFDTL